LCIVCRSAFADLAENVSVGGGAPVHAVDVTFTTRMIIVKLADGSLWVNSPVSVPCDMLDHIIASGVSGQSKPAT
jgi:hypothetical protein